MKKIIVLTVLASLGFMASAQNKGLQGTWFATSQFGYQQSKSGNVKSTNFTILPIVGNFVNPSVAVGLAFGYVNIKAETGSTVNANSGLVVVQPLVRKYWNVNGGLFFFGQLAVPVICPHSL